jgi:exonuclease SbcC
MKILAIRGENLASLKSFDVNLYGDILGETGLFSITGPTGAGKSTLLDALCLALYGRIPRIGEIQSSFEISLSESESLGVSDPRQVLRRGAATCFAEVEFEGVSGRWRARWSARRAHGKASGKVQKATVELHDLEKGEQVNEHRPTETFKLIEERIGLTYEQFCRSVLLAQGDFASFLKAKGPDRAALLEKMTGTELYSRVSILAHERSKTEAEKLRDLERDAGGLRVLAPEERDALAAELTDQQAENLRLTVDARQAEAAVRWHETAEQLHYATTAADDECKAAHAASEAAEPERVRQRRLEKAETVRALVAGFGGATRRATDARRNVGELQNRLSTTENEARQRAAAEREAREVFENTELVRQSLQPEIDAAKTLDVRLTDATASVEAAQRDLETAETERASAERRVRDGEAEAAEVQKRLDEAQTWLTANAGMSPVAAQWERWKAEIERFGAAREMREKLQLRLDGQSVARLEKENEAAILQKEAAVQTLAGEKEVFDAACAALQTFRDEFRPERFRADRDRLAKRLETLNEAERLARELAARAAERATELATAEREEQAAAACAARRDELTEAKLQREAARAARREELELARATEELAARRPDLLKPGRPCPLCGSTEHPDAEAVVHLSETVERLRVEVSTAERELADVQLRLTECERDRSVHQAKAAAARAAATKKTDDIAALTDRWNELRDEALPADPLAENVAEVLKDAKNAARDALETLAARETEAEELTRRRDAARDALNAATDAVTRATGQVFQTESALNDARRDRETTERELQTVLSTCGEAITVLNEPFSDFETDWRAELDADWKTFARNLVQKVEAWRKTETAKAAAEVELRDGAGELATARAELARVEASVGEKRRDFETKREARAAHAAERANLLDGNSVAETVARLDAAVRRAKETFETARAAVNQAEKDRAAAESALRQAELAVETSEKDAESARAALDAGILDAGFSNLETVRQLLDVPTSERAALSESLDGIARRVAQAETVFQERSTRLAAHLASDSPRLDPAYARDRATTLRASVEVVLRRIGEIEGRLKDDDDARERLADRLADAAKQRTVADRWARLDDLIGSADGKKFRVFAQSLTLDILLGAANHYLEKLRPRYRLERVPNQDMELQVIDHDLGDEIRTCGSLSGGETFLVSLSLALGLSSLSSRTVAIESLFIDEGFGTLDKDSLESAVAMLDQLQAEGRKIGIISHIPDLAERIGFQVAVTPTGNGTSRVSVRR